MRERALIHVAGPPGAGKTTLIEHLLHSANKLILAARCIREDRLRRPLEAAPKNQIELQRYREAGAIGVAEYRFALKDAHTDAFFVTSLMENYSEGVVLEGDRPFEYVDVTVFVAPPLAAGASLFRRVKGHHAEDRWLLDQMDAGVLSGIGKLRAAAPAERWALAEGYAGIEQAQVVVVNIRGETERPGAQRLGTDLAHLREDEAIFKDVLGWRGRRIPITAVVANLAEPGDPGLKKALARLKRAFPKRG